ncbi:MAG: hypothetical protein ACYC2H_01935 [Thermoplasmatota archaeon]
MALEFHMLPRTVRLEGEVDVYKQPRQPLVFFGIHPSDYDCFLAELGDDRLTLEPWPPIVVVFTPEAWLWVTSMAVQEVLNSIDAATTAADEGVLAGVAPLKPAFQDILRTLGEAGIVEFAPWNGQQAMRTSWRGGWRYQLSKNLAWKAEWDLYAGMTSSSPLVA